MTVTLAHGQHVIVELHYRTHTWMTLRDFLVLLGHSLNTGDRKLHELSSLHVQALG